TAPSPQQSATSSLDAAPSRPVFIPEKFWDGGAGRVRVEDLAKSYRALEQKLGRVAQLRQAEMRRAEDAATSPQASEPVLPGDPAADATSPDTSAPENEETAELAPDGQDAGSFDTSVPDAPEAYTVRVSHPWLERDAEIDGLLHAAGFNQA